MPSGLARQAAKMREVHTLTPPPRPVPVVRTCATALLVLAVLGGVCGCAEMSKAPDDSSQLTPALYKAIGVAPDQVRMLRAVLWWRRSGNHPPGSGRMALSGFLGDLGGGLYRIAVVTDEAIFIARPRRTAARFELLAKIPFDALDDAALVDGDSMLTLRHRPPSGTPAAAAQHDFICFFRFNPLLVNRLDNTAGPASPELAQEVAKLVFARLPPPLSIRVPAGLSRAERTRVIAVVAPSWRPKIQLPEPSMLRERAGQGAAPGSGLAQIGAGLGEIGGLAALPVVGAGLVVGAVGGAAGAAVGSAEDLVSDRGRAMRKLQDAVEQSGLPRVVAEVAVNAALRKAFLAAYQAVTLAEAPEHGGWLLLGVDDLAAANEDNDAAYLPLVDEGVLRFLELRLLEVEFAADADAATKGTPQQLPFRMTLRATARASSRLKASLGGGATGSSADVLDDWKRLFRGRGFDRVSARLSETSGAYTLDEWTAHDAALARTEFDAVCAKLGAKFAQLFNEDSYPATGLPPVRLTPP